MITGMSTVFLHQFENINNKFRKAYLCIELRTFELEHLESQFLRGKRQLDKLEIVVLSQYMRL